MISNHSASVNTLIYTIIMKLIGNILIVDKIFFIHIISSLLSIYNKLYWKYNV